MKLEAGASRRTGQARSLLSEVKVARNDLTLSDLALVQRRGGARLDAEAFPAAAIKRPGGVFRWL